MGEKAITGVVAVITAVIGVAIVAVILSKNGVLPNPLPATGSQPVLVPGSATTLRESERCLILQTLEEVRWVIGGPKGAATKLGLKRTTLIHKMQKLGISRPALPVEDGVSAAGQGREPELGRQLE